MESLEVSPSSPTELGKPIAAAADGNPGTSSGAVALAPQGPASSPGQLPPGHAPLRASPGSSAPGPDGPSGLHRLKIVGIPAGACAPPPRAVSDWTLPAGLLFLSLGSCHRAACAMMLQHHCLPHSSPFAGASSSSRGPITPCDSQLLSCPVCAHSRRVLGGAAAQPLPAVWQRCRVSCRA